MDPKRGSQESPGGRTPELAQPATSAGRSPSLTSISSPVLTSPPCPDPHLDVGIGTVDQPALERAGGLMPRGPGIDDPMTPHFARTLEHGAEPRVVLHRRPGPGEIEVDRQGVGGAAGPAPVGDAAVGAEDPDFVIIGKLRSHGPLALRLHRGPERSKAVRVVLGCRFHQGKGLGNLLNAPASPMVEEVGGFRVVARKLGQTLAAGGRATAGGLVSGRRIATRDPVIPADTRSIVRKVQPRLVAIRSGAVQRDRYHSRRKAGLRNEDRGIRTLRRTGTATKRIGLAAPANDTTGQRQRQKGEYFDSGKEPPGQLGKHWHPYKKNLYILSAQTSGGTRNGVSVSTGPVHDSVGSEDILAYLRRSAKAGINGGYRAGLVSVLRLRFATLRTNGSISSRPFVLSVAKRSRRTLIRQAPRTAARSSTRRRCACSRGAGRSWCVPLARWPRAG